MSRGSPLVIPGALTLILGLLLHGTLVVMTRPLVPHFDEIWFLQVLSRTASGDALYRDVYFNTTPLSVWISSPLLNFFGAELLVVRLLVVAIFTAVTMLLLVVARQFQFAARQRAVILLGSVAYAWTLPAAPYAPLATLFFLATLSFTRASLRSSRGFASLLAGVSAGLSFCSKPNIGLLALLACLATLAATGSLTRIRLVPAFARVLAGFAMVVGTTAILIGMNGATPRFLEYVVANKTTYVHLGMSYFLTDLRSLFRFASAAPSVRRALTAVVWSGAYLLFFLSILMFLARLVTAVRKRSLNPDLLLVAIFAATALAGVFPWLGLPHVMAMIPMALIALGYAMARDLRLASGALTVLFAVVILALDLEAAWRLTSRNLRWSAMPHFRGIRAEAGRLAEVEQEAHALRQTVPSHRTFLITYSAAFYYLSAGIHNPLPYDLPMRTNFGRHGEVKVADAIRRGDVREVVVFKTQPRQLKPVWLIEHVHRSMRLTAQTPRWTVYEHGPEGGDAKEVPGSRR